MAAPRLPEPGTITYTALHMMFENRSNTEIAAAIQRTRPGSRTTERCIASIRCEFKPYLPLPRSRHGTRTAKSAKLRLVA